MTRIRSGRPALAVLVLSVPWAWSVFFIPAWVSGICLLLLVPAWATLITMLRENHRAVQDAQYESIEQLHRQDTERLSRLHVTISNVQSYLGRWSRSSDQSRAGLKVAQAEMGEVIHHIQSAVFDIAGRFRSIITKTGQQMDCAMRLLQGADHASASKGAAAWNSLLDYIGAYELQLNQVTEQMAQFATVMTMREEYRRRMHEHIALVDDLLDELRSMARQTGKLALESSVLATNGSNDTQLGVVNLTDRIRAISDQTHEVTDRIRGSLEDIRHHIEMDGKALQDTSDMVRSAACQAKSEMAQLNVTTMEKMNEVEYMVSKISELGKEIKSDIAKIIVAMQFQDITQQKLERVHQPVLNTVIKQLRLLGEETTHVRSEVKNAVAGERVAPHPARAGARDGRSHLEGMAPGSDDDAPAGADSRPPDARKKEDGNAVELF